MASRFNNSVVLMQDSPGVREYPVLSHFLSKLLLVARLSIGSILMYCECRTSLHPRRRLTKERANLRRAKFYVRLNFKELERL